MLRRCENWYSQALGTKNPWTDFSIMYECHWNRVHNIIVAGDKTPRTCGYQSSWGTRSISNRDISDPKSSWPFAMVLNSDPAQTKVGSGSISVKSPSWISWLDQKFQPWLSSRKKIHSSSIKYYFFLFEKLIIWFTQIM